MMDALLAALPDLPGRAFSGRTVESADEFAYDDPVDGSRAEGQGIRVNFDGGGRVVYRLSGTGTAGATVRVYIEDVTEDPERIALDAETALADVVAAAREIADIQGHTGRSEPDVKT
jgi:phosphoglucomutase